MTFRHFQLFVLDCCDDILLYLIFLAPALPATYTQGAGQPAQEKNFRKPCAGLKAEERSEAA